MRKFLLVLVAFGLLAYAPVGAVAQGYALALGVQGKIQGAVNFSLLQNLSDEELLDIAGVGGQLFADAESYIFGGLWSAIGGCLCYAASQALGLSGVGDFAFQLAGNVAWSSLGTWLWKQGEISP
ncbi:hypothetical protein [Thermus scotoductus]|uniref:hypothetical protein n=1 Tax=Thermus scotoductus TaxID=37636 RepID=UPI000F80BFC6|nr:hypothetical protein [Thermus scotoductus]